MCAAYHSSCLSQCLLASFPVLLEVVTSSVRLIAVFTMVILSPEMNFQVPVETPLPREMLAAYPTIWHLLTNC